MARESAYAARAIMTTSVTYRDRRFKQTKYYILFLRNNFLATLLPFNVLGGLIASDTHRPDL